MRLASRVDLIEPFWVMECAKAADAIARSPLCDPAQGGRPMVYLNIGEPDQTAAPAVRAAAKALIDSGQTQYTPATGLPALREAIAGWYAQREGLVIDPARIVITAGASGALQLLTMALVEPGDQWLMADPAYPCNRHFITAAGGDARLLPAGPAERFQLDAPMVEAAWQPATRGVLLASPSNPTGTSITFETLQALAQGVRRRGGVLVADEIYQALSYGPSRSALHLGDDVIVVNSFSKYFGMTGWRLGWLVLPPALVAPIERLAQNFTICPSVIAQHAALACFTPETLALCEARRREFQARRDVIVPALNDLGLTVPVMPDGAFFAWLDMRRYATEAAYTSWEFCHDLMRRAQIALTPGRDFGHAHAAAYARLSFASSLPQLQEAVARLAQVLPDWPRS